MGKSATKSVEVSKAPAEIKLNQADAAEVQTTEEKEIAAAPGQTEEKEQIRLVLCAYPGKEELVKRIWDKMLPGVEKNAFTVEEGTPTTDILAAVIADTEVADKFVLVPPVAIPCAPVSFEELQMPVVFKDSKGARHYDNKLPVFIDKGPMAQLLGEDRTDNPEKVMEAYITSRGRAVEAAFKEGNFVTPVLRGNPCEHIVLEALVRKKYLTANQAGLEAITPLLRKALLDE